MLGLGVQPVPSFEINSARKWALSLWCLSHTPRNPMLWRKRTYVLWHWDDVCSIVVIYRSSVSKHFTLSTIVSSLKRKKWNRRQIHKIIPNAAKMKQIWKLKFGKGTWEMAIEISKCFALARLGFAAQFKHLNTLLPALFASTRGGNYVTTQLFEDVWKVLPFSNKKDHIVTKPDGLFHES